MKTQKPRFKKHGLSADKHWKDVMALAERYGFILQAAGGVATLATHAVQLEELGETEYLRIQSMNGHCPKENGYDGCLDETGQLKGCRNCWAEESGSKYVNFQKKEN